MLKTLLTTALGLTAAATLTVEAEGCSYAWLRPTETTRAPTLAELIVERNRPLIADLIRTSAYVDIAVTDRLEPLNNRNDRVIFHQIESIKGGGGDFGISVLGEIPIAGTGAHSDERSRSYLDQFREDPGTLDSFRLPLGHSNRTSCGNAVGAFVREGWTYLVVHDGDDSGAFAIPLADHRVEIDSEALSELESHQWVVAARHALARPSDPAIHQISLRDFIEIRSGATVVEVDDCERPTLTTMRNLGSGGSTFWLNSDEVPTTLEAYLESYEASWVDLPPGAPPLGEDDFRVLDERRYDSVPFDAETCRVGQQYLLLGYYQIFEIDEQGIVDFSNIPTQLSVYDAGRVHIETVRSWIAEAQEDESVEQ